MLAIFLLCMVAFAAAQQPKPCMTPPQWEANVFDNNELNKFMVRGRLSYDATNHRERIVEEVDEDKEQMFFDVIALFDLQVEFVYDFKARNCSRRPLTRPWRDFGIAPNAKSFGEAYIGTSALPGMGLLVTLW